MAPSSMSASKTASTPSGPTTTRPISVDASMLVMMYLSTMRCSFGPKEKMGTLKALRKRYCEM